MAHIRHDKFKKIIQVKGFVGNCRSRRAAQRHESVVIYFAQTTWEDFFTSMASKLDKRSF